MSWCPQCGGDHAWRTFQGDGPMRCCQCDPPPAPLDIPEGVVAVRIGRHFAGEWIPVHYGWDYTPPPYIKKTKGLLLPPPEGTVQEWQQTIRDYAKENL